MPETHSSTIVQPLRCPNDGSRLVEVERSGVLIDACPECRGVWLDRGELDKILVQERQLSSSDPDEDFLDEVEDRGSRRRKDEPRHEGKRRRRRGLLEDLLDSTDARPAGAGASGYGEGTRLGLGSRHHRREIQRLVFVATHAGW
jgi:Zn-finger nucleic acid-binding protein